MRKKIFYSLILILFFNYIVISDDRYINLNSVTYSVSDFFKNEKETGTTTEIRLLSKNERVVEIAKLLSGEQTTDAAMTNARELLG